MAGEFTMKDGRHGTTADVNANHELKTFSITEPLADRAAEVGQRYNINTGHVTLNSAGESAMLYVKNNEDDVLVITALIYNLGASTDGSGSARVDVYRNPTSGTIVSTATQASAVSNMNFGSDNTLTGNFYAGAQSLTQTGGAFSIGSLLNAGSRAVVSLGAVELPKGKSLSVTVTPPVGNTSMLCNIAASCYLKTNKVSGARANE